MMIEATVERALNSRVLALGSLVVALLAAWLLVAAEPAHSRPPLGNSFTVNSIADLADANLEDSVCDVDLAQTGNQCTLRAAIQEANDTPNDTFNGSPVNDSIRFNIAGTGVQTISPASELPPITEAVTIDGYTQPGTSRNTLAKGTNAVLLIELDGTNAGPANGLHIDQNAPNSVIRGLVINRFFGQGIFVVSTGSRVEGNFVGTGPGGTQDLGNTSDGVGVNFGGSGINVSDVTVGGASPDKRNLISGNRFGVGIRDFRTTNVKVQGNLIGTNKDGTADLGNDFAGVFIDESSDNAIGGNTAGEANTIAFNEGFGVDLRSDDEDSLSNRILRNSIFFNFSLGIDLNGDGPTANDPGDPDTGPNNLQNKPTLTSAKSSASATTIRGRLSSTPATTFQIQFFSNPSGTNEGKKFIGQTSVTTGSDGLATFIFSPTKRVAVGQTITATATDPGGNTSEFSAPRAVVAQ